MGNPRPLKRLLEKVKDSRVRHRERHRPSGFAFLVADSIDFLDAQRWDAVAGPSSVFIGRPYLGALEAAGPRNIQQRYALIFRGPKPVAAMAAQLVKVSADRLAGSAKGARGGGEAGSLGNPLSTAVRRLRLGALERVQTRILVCGNLLSWGCHGAAFAPGEDPAALWPAVAEAIYRIRRAEKLSGQTDFALVKDIAADQAGGAEALRRFSYRPLETDPDMVLDLPPEWRSYDDYLGSLNSRYRRSALGIAKETEAAGCRVEPLPEVARHADRLHALYLQVLENARVRPAAFEPGFLPALAAALGPSFRCIIVRRGDDILGFVTVIRDGETAVGYYIGFDRAASAEIPLYLRLLQAVVAEAIALGCRRLSLGRTALEPKARLGAAPRPLQVWIRHRIPAMNLLVRNFIKVIHHDEPPVRDPFK